MLWMFTSKIKVRLIRWTINRRKVKTISTTGCFTCATTKTRCSQCSNFTKRSRRSATVTLRRQIDRWVRLRKDSWKIYSQQSKMTNQIWRTIYETCLPTSMRFTGRRLGSLTKRQTKLSKWRKKRYLSKWRHAFNSKPSASTRRSCLARVMMLCLVVCARSLSAIATWWNKDWRPKWTLAIEGS